MAYPSEPWPSNATIEALDGTTDSPTGINYVAKGVNALSSPSLQVQIDRMLQRMCEIMASVNELRVVKVAALAVGVFPGKFRVAGTAYSYAGSASISGADGVAFSDGDDTYYLWIDATNAIRMATDSSGWPADAGTFIPLAEVTVSSSAITAVADVRNRARLSTWSSYDADLAAIAALSTNGLIERTGSGTAAIVTCTTAGKALLDDADAAAQRSTLELVPGTNVQAYDADLAAIAGLSSAGLVARTGAGTASARSVAAGVGISVSNGDGSAGNPTISLSRVISPKTTSYEIQASDNQKVFTDEGASGPITFTLPSAAAGLEIVIVAMTANQPVVDCASGDVFRLASSTATRATANATVGHVLRLTAVNSTDWVVEGLANWSFSTP